MATSRADPRRSGCSQAARPRGRRSSAFRQSPRRPKRVAANRRRSDLGRGCETRRGGWRYCFTDRPPTSVFLAYAAALLSAWPRGIALYRLTCTVTGRPFGRRSGRPVRCCATPSDPAMAGDGASVTRRVDAVVHRADLDLIIATGLPGQFRAAAQRPGLRAQLQLRPGARHPTSTRRSTQLGAADRQADAGRA